MALLTRLLGELLAIRLLVYAGGVVAIAGVTRLGSDWLRVPVVVAALTLMCLTYFAELSERSATDRSTTRLVAATAGVAVGSYLVVAVNRVAGVAFLAGAVLFFRAAVRTTETGAARADG